MPYRSPVLAAAFAALIGSGTSAEIVIKTGSFAGAGPNEATGSVFLVREGDKWSVVLGDDFTVSNVADAKLLLGEGSGGTDLGPLAADAGSHAYVVPAGIDAEGFSEIVIWCAERGEPLGTAEMF